MLSIKMSTAVDAILLKVLFVKGVSYPKMSTVVDKFLPVNI